MKLYICIGITLALMLYAFITKAINIKGILAAGIITFGLAFYGGYPVYGMVILIFFVDKLFHVLTKNKADHKRNEYQILANLLLPYIAIILYAYYDKEIYLLISIACLAEVLADCLASTVGVCAKHHMSLKNFKIDDDNCSGTISVLGTLASVFGAQIIAIIYYCFINNDLKTYLLIVIIASFGAMIDSILGTFLQATYQCSKCKKKVDDPKHCNRKTKHISGFKFITNNMVNLLTQIITFVISLIIL